MTLGRRLLVALALSVPLLAMAAEQPEAPSPPRPVPDYDGLPPPGATPGEVVAWVPRIVLFPAWLVSEFLFRRPFLWLTITAEKGNWPTEIVNFFTFGGSNMGIVPTFFVDLGFRPTFGVYYFWDHAGHPRHYIRFRGSGTVDGYAVALADRWTTDDKGSRLQFEVDVSLRPDRSFYGIGPDTLDSDQHRYGMFRGGGSILYRWQIVRGIRLQADVGLHRMAFTTPRCCGNPPVSDLPVPPPGFEQGGYSLFGQGIEAVFDTRPPRPDTQSGIRLRLAANLGTDLQSGANWFQSTGTLGLFWDIAGLERILGLTFTASDIEKLDGEVPFPELVTLGGNGLAMPGLRTERLYGESALSASLRYEWPIWVAAAGSLQVEVGNVFGRHFEGFALDRNRLSFAFGLRTSGEPDHAFQLLFGFGTETFAHGTQLTSFRFAIGGTYGF